MQETATAKKCLTSPWRRVKRQPPGRTGGLGRSKATPSSCFLSDKARKWETHEKRNEEKKGPMPWSQMRIFGIPASGSRIAQGVHHNEEERESVRVSASRRREIRTREDLQRRRALAKTNRYGNSRGPPLVDDIGG